MTIAVGCACADPSCAQLGCKYGRQQLYQGYTPPPRGCICPPGANKDCEADHCPRKPSRLAAACSRVAEGDG